MQLAREAARAAKERAALAAKKAKNILKLGGGALGGLRGRMKNKDSTPAQVTPGNAVNAGPGAV